MNEETLSHQARVRPAGERAAFLEHACAGDAELRRRVEALLWAHDASGTLLVLPSLEDVRGEDRSVRASESGDESAMASAILKRAG